MSNTAAIPLMEAVETTVLWPGSAGISNLGKAEVKINYPTGFSSALLYFHQPLWCPILPFLWYQKSGEELFLL